MSRTPCSCRGRTSDGRRRRRVRRAVWALGAVALAAAALPLGHVVVWRTQWRPGIDALRRFHRRARPLVMGSAGAPGTTLAAVHHTGRWSGRVYATPVWAHPAGEAFYVGLPYGEDTDWVRNVRAAGGCVVQLDGTSHEAGSPSFVDLEHLPVELWPKRQGFRRLGVRTFLRLEVVTPAA